MKPADYIELRALVRYDARQRVFRLSACEGKHRFDSFTAAQRTMRSELRRVAHVYHCKACHGFHIGNRENTRRGRIYKGRA